MKTTEIIDHIVLPQKSKFLVRRMIPILVRWAKGGFTNKTYGDMAHALGYSTFSGIGHQLGYVHLVMKKLCELTKTNIPTLNALCKSKKNNMPSYGFDFVNEKYSSLSLNDQEYIISKINEDAISYLHWDSVLEKLGLESAPLIKEAELKIINNYGSGGESEEHKQIKKIIIEHPDSIGITNVAKSELEHSLPSGDRIDVFFTLKDGTRIAVEVKPKFSPEEDHLRGIFQCVKYYAVMDALAKLESEQYNIETILVISGQLSDKNKIVAEELGISYIENYY